MKINAFFLLTLFLLSCTQESGIEEGVGLEPSVNPLETIGLPLDPVY